MTEDLSSQAFSWAAHLAAEQHVRTLQYTPEGETPPTLEATIRNLIRRADPLSCRGTNSEGAEISFTWSFGYEDVAAIAVFAQRELGPDEIPQWGA